MATARAASGRATTTTRAVVLKPFTGLEENERVFMPGEVFEGTRDRVSRLRALGFLSEKTVRKKAGAE